MEKKRETTVFILELYRGYIGYILGIYWDNYGKENVNYGDLGGYIGGLYWGYVGIMDYIL